MRRKVDIRPLQQNNFARSLRSIAPKHFIVCQLCQSGFPQFVSRPKKIIQSIRTRLAHEFLGLKQEQKNPLRHASIWTSSFRKTRFMLWFRRFQHICSSNHQISIWARKIELGSVILPKHQPTVAKR